MKLTCSLVISIFLYACESWTLTTSSWRKEPRPLRCYKRILNFSYKDHVTNEEVSKGSKQALENMMNTISWSRNREEGGFATSEGLLV